MTEGGVEVLGFSELASGTRKLAGLIQDAAERDFLDVASEVAAKVQSALPRKTGRLAGTAEAHAQGGAAIVSMGEGVPYARFVEYGGRGHPHSPQGNYLYPQAMDAEPALIAAGQKAAEHEIGGFTWPSVT